MCFKFKRIDFIAGSDKFPVGYTDSLRRTRSENVLKAAAEAIISMNIGWVLDTSRRSDSTSTSKFANVPCRSGGLTYPALFLKNSKSGCKLFLSYFGGPCDAANTINDFSNPSGSFRTDLFGYGNAHIGGMCASIIPSGSSQSFGKSFTSNFLPSDATRIIGTCFYYSYTSSDISHCSDPTSGYSYSWGIYATDSTIAISSNYDSRSAPNLGFPVYVTGKLFDNLVHEEDTAVNSKYGSFIFRIGNYPGEKEGTQTLMKYSISNQTTSGTIPLRKVFDTKPIYEYTTASISKANGIWVNANINDNTNGVGYVADFLQITSNCYTPSVSETRWLPINVTILATDLNQYGVIPGDGFKGWLDTDLFRCAVSSYGKTYDNGKFICPENNFNMIIGWDPTNTDKIQGV